MLTVLREARKMWNRRMHDFSQSYIWIFSLLCKGMETKQYVLYSSIFNWKCLTWNKREPLKKNVVVFLTVVIHVCLWSSVLPIFSQRGSSQGLGFFFVLPLKVRQTSNSGSVLYKKKLVVVIFRMFCSDLLARENVRGHFS